MINTVTQDDFNALVKKASQVERKRAHFNLHETSNANVQRLLMAMEPETYICPHRHIESHKWEMVMLLSGEIDVLIFNDEGELLSRIHMSSTATRVIQLPANTWHSYVGQQTETLALEIKEGPYIAQTDKEFAPWAPIENTQEAVVFLERLRALSVGSQAGVF